MKKCWPTGLMAFILMTGLIVCRENGLKAEEVELKYENSVLSELSYIGFAQFLLSDGKLVEPANPAPTIEEYRARSLAEDSLAADLNYETTFERR